MWMPSTLLCVFVGEEMPVLCSNVEPRAEHNKMNKAHSLIILYFGNISFLLL